VASTLKTANLKEIRAKKPVSYHPEYWIFFQNFGFDLIQLGEFLIKMNSDCLHSCYKQNTKFIGF